MCIVIAGDYEVSDCDDIHALTGAVRLFFRELTEPLIPFDFFGRFCDSYSKFIWLFSLILHD